MLGGSGSLICNDRSSDRKGRLMRTIMDYVPERCRGSITVTNRDASKWFFNEPQVRGILMSSSSSSSSSRKMDMEGEEEEGDVSLGSESCFDLL